MNCMNHEQCLGAEWALEDSLYRAPKQDVLDNNGSLTHLSPLDLQLLNKLLSLVSSPFEKKKSGLKTKVRRGYRSSRCTNSRVLS